MDRHGSITDIRDDIHPNVGGTTWLPLRTHDAAMRTATARPAVSPLLPSASLRPAANRDLSADKTPSSGSWAALLCCRAPR